MNMLFVNHGAKGIAMWDYPTEPGIANITGLLSKALTSSEVSGFLLGAFEQAMEVEGLQRIDAAAWTVGNKILVSVVNKSYVGSGSNVSIALPGMASTVEKVVWGSGWSVGDGVLWKSGLDALEVDIFIVS